MKRVFTVGAKALSAGVARRGFQTVKSVVPKVTAPTMRMATRFSSSLTEVLAVEIDEETNKDGDEIDQDLIDVKTQIQKVFKVQEDVGVSVVKLTRKHGDESIEVAFNVQDIEDAGDDGIQEGDNEEDEPEDSGVGINFCVTIKRGKNSVVIDALAGDALTIQNVRYIDEKHADSDEIDRYTGPQFHDLEESVQAAFYEYLTERNIDDDLSFFILAYSRDKEQTEYVNWLQKMQNFTAGAEK